ncbi:MAG TPA: hypothetical protein VLT32_14320, partial [Candidatus Sulfomarinibacteraceae bacterium]|nr:hypothetical protein [Candidatus Sulfomarinibacteraceae bacterium]
PRPGETVAALRQLMPIPDLPAVDGGGIAATAALAGELGDPRLTAEVSWEQPEIAGRRLQTARLTADGGVEQLQWSFDLEVTEGTVASARGTARPFEARAEGSWQVSVVAAGKLVDWAAPELGLEPMGELEAEGTLRFAEGEPRVTGTVAAHGLGVQDWVIESLRFGFEADPHVAVVRDIRLEGLGGVLEGSLQVALGGASQELAASLSWRDLDLSRVPLELPPEAAGVVDGSLNLEGPLAKPRGGADLSWRGGPGNPLLERLGLHAELDGGTLTVSLEETASDAGRFVGEVVVPLGGVPRPEWLWPDAPVGAVHGRLEVDGFRSRPLMEAFGPEDVGFEVDAEADLGVEFVWDPQRPHATTARFEARGLKLKTPQGDLVADGPAVATIEGTRFELQPLVLVGLGSRIEAEAAYRPDSNEVVARVRSTISGVLARLLPLPVSVRGPVRVDADIRVPAVVEGALAGLRGTLTIDHREGSLVMRDPPVEVRNLQLGMTLRGGAISSIDGSAEVNRGTVEFGGGWDPSSGQGVVLDLEGVTMFTEGVLTRWDGELAIEPHSGRLAMVVGDLNLVAGLWDEDFSLASAFFGGEKIELASDDPLHEIGLDLDVRGRTGIRVDNNLGRFHSSWDVLRVGGTGAEPRIRGEVRISPGGVIVIGGTEVAVRRGSLR